jgi:broad specificity phosphatase PhoE
MGKLILVRHGHTSLNKPGEDERLRAWLDVPLDEKGIQEAFETAGKLSDYSIDSIYCSDLKRARQTAQILRRRVKARITPTQELRPWNLGVFGGEKIKDILPFLNLMNDRTDIPAPSGESFDQFYARYAGRLRDLLDVADKSTGCVLAVTHVRNLLAATIIIQGGNKSEVPACGGPGTGTITIVERIEGSWNLRREDGRDVVQKIEPPPGAKPTLVERRSSAMRSGLSPRRRSVRATA